MKTNFKIILFCIFSFAFISCDRVTKNIAKEQLMNREPTSYFHDTFRLEYAENTGAALSLGATLPQPYNFILLSVVPMLFLSALFIYALIKIKEFTLIRILSFALVFAGGVGNIIDRVLFDRHVTDFMNFGIQNIRTGIFNVADVCITAGVIGLFFSYQNEKAATDQVNAHSKTI
ncbi:signal peptidase II [Mucilaginibacter arboris]|uniref:Lipoprotein signal peptidase n=1 Tax=Mucilaginibacter arboris TaxID=2682090 RepID=A0A7K1SYQ2_9SPHI|nr:signal peptidase II [Mucilaginibacter arboris]MVN22454.1 signal peptidase II [Mucilaginibacter arboris]